MTELSESRLRSIIKTEISTVHSDVKRLSREVERLRTTVEDLKLKVQRVEDSSKYTAGYVAMRLKERYDKSY